VIVLDCVDAPAKIKNAASHLMPVWHQQNLSRCRLRSVSIFLEGTWNAEDMLEMLRSVVSSKCMA